MNAGTDSEKRAARVREMADQYAAEHPAQE